MITRVEELKQRNGRFARPNVYRRSLAPLYLSLEQQPADVEDSVPELLQQRVWVLAVSVLAVVLLCVGLWLN